MERKRQRTRTVSTEEVQQPIKKLFKKTGGGTLIFDNHYIKPGQLFWADPNKLPKAFMDTIEEVDEGVASALTQKKPAAAPETYSVKPVGKGEFNVVNGAGKAINTAPLSEKAANELKSVLED